MVLAKLLLLPMVSQCNMTKIILIHCVSTIEKVMDIFIKCLKTEEAKFIKVVTVGVHSLLYNCSKVQCIMRD